MSSLLITGIHGFVGGNLVSSLRSQHKIYGLDIVLQNKVAIEKTYSWGELINIQKIDVVIHLAGKAHDTRNQTSLQEYINVNTELTKKIFNWFLASDAKIFIFFSSVKAVADSVEDVLTEEVVPTANGAFGQSKMLAEKYILSQTLPPNKKVYILRPCMIHGPGNKGNLNLLYKLVQKGFPWPLGDFENRRTFTSIENLNYIISQLIESEIEPGIYQVADDEALSTNELIKLIAAAQNRPSKIWNLPKKLVGFMAKLGDQLHLPLNSERLKKLTESYVVSNEKLKKALHIEKMPVTAIEGLKKTFQSF